MAVELKYHRSESAEYPELVDTTSSQNYVYLRKNVQEETRTNSMGDSETTMTMYVYEEALITKEEYNQYLNEQNAGSIEQLRADVDFVLVMNGGAV